jgi:hypothetical protein
MSAWHKIAYAAQCSEMGVKSRRMIRNEKPDAQSRVPEKATWNV